MNQKQTYLCFEQFKSKTIEAKSQTTVFNNVKRTVMMMRGVFLIEMYNTEDNSFFEIPSVPDLFVGIYNAEIFANFIYPSKFVQIITGVVENIYSYPHDFISDINRHFEGDISDCYWFAYSVFPAIYGCFVTEEFLNHGSDFLILYMMNTKNQFLSELLLISFFAALPVFYNYFLSAIAKEIETISTHTSFKTNLSTLMKVLKQSLPLMTSNHIKVLKTYIETFEGSECIFIKKILIPKFKESCDSSEVFINAKTSSIFYNFLDKLSNSKEESIKVLNVMFDHTRFISILPTMDSEKWSNGFPLIFCDRDFLVLSYILSESKKLKLDNKIDFGDKILPRIVPVYPYFFRNSNEIPVDNIGFKLFGLKPERIEQKQSQLLTRKWNHMVLLSQRDNVSMYDLVERVNDEQKDELKIRLHNEYCDNFNLLERAIILEEQSSKHKRFLNEVYTYMNNLFNMFSRKYIFQKVRGQEGDLMSRINVTIKSILQNLDVPRAVKFAILCTALDGVKFNKSFCEELDNRFSIVMSRWADTDWSRVSSIPFIKAKKKYIMWNAYILMNIDQLHPGQRLNSMIEFVNRLHTILGGDNNKLMHDVFKMSIFMANDSNGILPAFLFIIHYVVNDPYIDSLRLLDNKWEQFAAGMWSFITSDEEFFKMCISKNYCHRLLLKS